MNELFEDLRMFIGAFFLISGGVLLALGAERSPGAPDLLLNTWTGAAFIAFGIFAVAAAIAANRKPGGKPSR